MKRALLGATACVGIVGSACGLAYAQLQVDKRQDKEPVVVIHGSADQTIMPRPTAEPQRSPGALPGYPIERLEKLREASK